MEPLLQIYIDHLVGLWEEWRDAQAGNEDHKHFVDDYFAEMIKSLS